MMDGPHADLPGIWLI